MRHFFVIIKPKLKINRNLEKVGQKGCVDDKTEVKNI